MQKSCLYCTHTDNIQWFYYHHNFKAAFYTSAAHGQGKGFYKKNLSQFMSQTGSFEMKQKSIYTWLLFTAIKSYIFETTCIIFCIFKKYYTVIVINKEK